MAEITNARQNFEEQLRALRLRLANLVPTQRWDDLWQAQHDRAFMVAGAAKADLLADLAGAVEAAIAGGQSIEWFRSRFDEVVARHGWAYTGERNWRTRVIYRTNMATSYAAGRLAQLRDPDLQRLKPYWMYQHNDSVLHPRPLHVSWDGLTLPADDPWFQTHYPPNGWGCQCYIIAVSAAEARRRGGRMVPPPDDGIDPVTGAPNGIDRGWDYMPGGSVTDDLLQQISNKLPTLPPPLAQALADDVASITATPSAPLTLDEMLSAGEARMQAVLVAMASEKIEMSDPFAFASAFRRTLRDQLHSERGMDKQAAVVGKGAAAQMVREASTYFPDEWIPATDALGKLHARASKSRAFQYTVPEIFDGKKIKLPVFGNVQGVVGEGYIAADSLASAVHELAHRVQSALPALDDYFQMLHGRRTAGEPLQSMKSLTGYKGYGPNEVARPDKYIHPYQGREYSKGGLHGALEVMSMALEFLWMATPDQFAKLIDDDPEMLRLTLGLLFNYRP